MDNDYGEVIVGFVFGMGYHIFMWLVILWY